MDRESERLVPVEEWAGLTLRSKFLPTVCQRALDMLSTEDRRVMLAEKMYTWMDLEFIIVRSSMVPTAIQMVLKKYYHHRQVVQKTFDEHLASQTIDVFLGRRAA